MLIYYALIAGLVSLFLFLTIPSLIKEGADLIMRLQSDSVWVVILGKMRHGLGDGFMDKIEQLILMASSEDIQRAAAAAVTKASEAATKRTHVVGSALHMMLREYTEAAVLFTSSLLATTTKAVVNVTVSLILSFMLVWDLPNISRGMRTLRDSRIGPAFREIAPALQVFGTLFGRALEAQARISMTNTLLTAIGLWSLNIPGVALLSSFVFVSGFIPIAGVFISTLPMGFVALTEYGFAKLGMVVLMVVGIHFVEAYALNPAIYSAHLKLHPLLVLSVLVAAEHSLGVVGLLMAVPLTVFALDYCIRYPESSAADVARAELVPLTKDGEGDKRDPWGSSQE